MIRSPQQNTKTDHSFAASSYPVIVPLPQELGPYELIQVRFYVHNDFY